MFWKATCSSTRLYGVRDCYVKSFIQHFSTSYPVEIIALRQMMKRSAKQWKRKCSLFDKLSKSEHFSFVSTRTLAEPKKILFVGQLETKATFNLVRWHFSKVLFRLYKQLTLRVEKNQKLSLTVSHIWLCFEKMKKCVWSKNFREYWWKKGFATLLPLDADESMRRISSMPRTGRTTPAQILWSYLLPLHLSQRIVDSSIFSSTNVKLQIWCILPWKQIGVRLKARVMVDKRDAFGLNWEVSTQISIWYHILLILVKRQNANIVQFTQMQQMLNDWEGLWYWLLGLWHSKRVLNFESRGHASLVVKML